MNDRAIKDFQQKQQYARYGYKAMKTFNQHQNLYIQKKAHIYSFKVVALGEY